MPVLSVCARRTQVNEHCRVFQDQQNGLPAPTVPYDHSQAFRPGVDNYVTTLDSLRKIKKVFSITPQTSGSVSCTSTNSTLSSRTR
jgi:hypothetical protein